MMHRDSRWESRRTTLRPRERHLGAPLVLSCMNRAARSQSISSVYDCRNCYSGKNNTALKRNRNTAAEPSHSQIPKGHSERFCNL